MSRYSDQQPGGFGGPQIVKPQPNVYTVLLLVAVLFMFTALAIQVVRYFQLQAKLSPKAAATPTSVTVAMADPSAGRYLRMI